MNFNKWIIPAALCAAMPLFADDAKITTAAVDEAATAVATVDDAATAVATSDDAQQTTPPQQGDEPQEGAPTAEEVAGKVESLGEAFTEMKNVVDALNRMKLSGYLQAQYVNDERSTNELNNPTSTRNL